MEWREIWMQLTILAAVILVSIGVPRQSMAVDMSSGLAGEWLLTEGRDNHVQDSSGNGNHGLAEGVKWIELEAAALPSTKYVLDFSGDAARVNCGRAASLDITGPVTLETWVFPSAQAPSEICRPRSGGSG